MSTSDIELAVTTARRLETLLETRFGASGRGLHEKLTSVQTSLSPDALRNGRYVATMRNKVVHEDAFSLPDRDRFLRSAQAFENALGGPARTGRKIPWSIAIFLLGVAILWNAPMVLKWVGSGPLAVAALMLVVPPFLWLRPFLRSPRLPGMIILGFVVFAVGWMIAAPIVFKDVIEQGRKNHAAGTVRP